MVTECVESPTCQFHLDFASLIILDFLQLRHSQFFLFFFKAQLLSKRDKLTEQLSEAGRLKSNIDRRCEAAAATVGRHLGARAEREHRRFLRAKVQLILRAREAQDRAAAAEEQAQALRI